MKSLDLIRDCIETDTPVLLWGAPGVGKTAYLLALAKERGAHVETLIGSTLDPMDVGGLLVPNGREAHSIPPPWATRLREAAGKGEAWLFLDEISCAPPSVQAPLLRVVNERKVGECDLKGVRMLAAANPAETAADGGWLSAAAANRWAHTEFTPSPDSWIVGTLQGWGKEQSEKEAKAATLVAGWIKHSPASLLAVPRGEQQGRAWPSPRSWTAAIKLLARAEESKQLDYVAACVGMPEASAWQTWTTTLDLPDPEEVLLGRAKLPARGDQVATCLGGVVSRAIMERADKRLRVEAAWRVLGKVRPDVALNAAAVLVETDVDIPKEAIELGRKVIAARGR